jgi:endoglucanase
MDERPLTFLKRLLDAAGPSGFEHGPARIWREVANGFASQVEVDVGGNCIARLRPGSGDRGGGVGRPHVMFAGHLDEIGVMVVHIDDDGFLHFAPIGGWDSQVLVGQRVILEGRSGTVTGVIGKKAIHLMKHDERDKVSKITDLWLDIGATSKAEAEARVRVGDAGVIATSLVELPNGRIVSRAIDNRIGAFVVLEALRLLASNPPRATVTAVGTTQEEISYSGGGARSSAFALEPDAAIVVDVTHATDFPGAEKKEHGEFKLGSGPVISRGSAVSRVVFEQLVAAAEAEQIPYRIEAAAASTHTDADSIYTARRGVATGLVSVPCRYMHSPNEMVALEDLERAARLLAAWARRLAPDTSFIPV